MSYNASPLVFEEHSSVLAEWWQRGLQGQTLIYLDAHLDLQSINHNRLQRLLDANSAATVQSLEKPSHLLPDGDYVHSLENFLYPASRLGIIDHLIWVAPPHIDVGLTPSVIEHVQQMDGITFEELSRFRRSEGGWLEGRLAGLKITICRLEHLTELALPSHTLLDIDTDFFVALPQDRAWISPAEVYRLLHKAVPKPDLITLSRSVSSGFMPLRYRYFADHLKALFEQDRESAAHFETLYQLQRSSDRLASQRKLMEELERYPQCAATHYLCAEDSTHPESYQSSAAAICKAYAFDPFQIASETANRHLQTSSHTLDRLAQRLGQAPLITADTRLIALGLAYAERGAPEQALQCYQRYGQPHPALALAIAERLTASTQHPQLFDLLTTATTEDASGSVAQLMLASWYLKKENISAATTALEIAHARAPAWLAPLRGLAQLQARSTPPGTRNRFATLLAERVATLGALIR
ncbi:MAG: tetratricopeptide (TPR) repeat protein [Motiliproteus sp.]|jgi:tetratricopeptide (TPR) repeat protein